MTDKCLTIENLNPAIRSLQYAVTGKIATRATEIEKELKQGASKPFDIVIRVNHGDCHENGQKPITFLRQVMAVCTFPNLLNSDKFPQDVKDRAVSLLNSCQQSIGTYTEGYGIDIIRKDIADFISRRDGISCDFENIWLTTGASAGIKNIIKIIINESYEKPTGIMIPIPQYPLYSATICEFGAYQISYFLDEDNNWALNIEELERAYQESLDKCIPRAICIINPGNPTGQVLSLENIKEIIKWAFNKKLFILADEVYQDNVYDEGIKFHSFKKVAFELGYPYCNAEIVSFYSASKGYMGECGIRGGYFEVLNMDPAVKVELKKFLTTRSCSPVLGQICMDTIANPPKEGEPSYELFMKEKQSVLGELKEKAKLITESLNKIKGVKCNPVQGAMYAFPQIKIPEKAIDHARKNDMEADVFYCLELLEQAGICVVPGSGFHQKSGTYHFRTTILQPIDKIKLMLEKFEKFHLNFIETWS